ncbi:cryptochrome/photolyase family protein [Thalassotalea mangrovi]|uniref:Cryptochrome/photolyase family protein n=1 Tax=Thalassotalea mangrovi TaxID=2572245 RepID=A0A4U1BBU1_9GAMM|nr:cryptochrome/photolyase family protein [Thalassotalea mangrovi]TKB47489.1 cryptochrome/photolyase family protein [Thalassotalea mangrovi]
MKSDYKRLRLILGDQLNAGHSWYQQKDSDTLYIIAELHQETTYVCHHVQKVCAFFAAMQQFSSALTESGFDVIHLTLDDTEGFNDLPELLRHYIDKYQVQEFHYQLADEYRLRRQLTDFANTLSIVTKAYTSEHFFIDDAQLSQHFESGKRHQMEAFYRRMRQRFDILMDGDEPEGGEWNYDKYNRNKLKADDLSKVPEPCMFANDVSDILKRLERHKVRTIGDASPELLWPINRQQSLELLEHFCRSCLPYFGTFQDAMTDKLDPFGEDRQWSLFHSRLSFSLNSKMLSPDTVIRRVIEYYRQHSQRISLAQVEGFVRQILGWREFIRGVYWANMPEYRTLNALQANRSLPEWFWSGDTKMRCLHHAISQSLQFAYAHHIQRLMITGNFCLIAGIDHEQVDEWYLGIYVDAIEWVELPNTRGMSQFADGGIVGSKAYAASGNYVNKMSDYCGDCHYQVKETETDNACPLNALYWYFMDSHIDKFNNNPRTRMVYANWQKKSPEQQQAIIARAQQLLCKIDDL